MFKIPTVVKSNKLIQVNIGQSDGDTRWNGNKLRFKFDILIL